MLKWINPLVKLSTFCVISEQALCLNTSLILSTFFNDSKNDMKIFTDYTSININKYSRYLFLLNMSN